MRNKIWLNHININKYGLTLPPLLSLSLSYPNVKEAATVTTEKKVAWSGVHPAIIHIIQLNMLVTCVANRPAQQQEYALMETNDPNYIISNLIQVDIITISQHWSTFFSEGHLKNKEMN